MKPLICCVVGIAISLVGCQREPAPDAEPVATATPRPQVEAAAPAATTPTDSHGWLATERLKTRSGEFEFKGGYPTPESAKALQEQMLINRAAEVYLTQMPAVAVAQTCKGLRAEAAGGAEPFVIWESLMDAKTLLLTANTETVYGLGCVDLKANGPTVLVAPPKMLGNAMDALQRFLVDIGPLGPDKGQGGRYLFLPPGYEGPVPAGYFVVKSPSNTILIGVRSFKVDGKTDQAVALMKQLQIHPLSADAHPAPMNYVDGSGKPIDTIHSDTASFYEELSAIVQGEPADLFPPLERFQMEAIGIHHGRPSATDDAHRKLLTEGARLGAAMARANSFASPDRGTYYYDDRQWQYVGDIPYTWARDGVLEVDRRAYVYYMALGNSPAMMEKNVGVGSYYLWAYRDATGLPLDGSRQYRLHIPANVPAKDFWSVLVYDAISRSQIQNDQKFPSVSVYTGPKANPDGSVDVYFGPTMPEGQEKNWIQTIPGRGWFPIVRFYGPQPPLYDKTWSLPDVERLK
jgi:hypothetical protein